MSQGTSASNTSFRAQVSGHIFTFRRRDVMQAVRRAEPGEIRDHFVEIEGRRYPVKQALAVATGLDPSDFTSQHARSVLRRLGLRLGRLSATRGTNTTRQPRTATVSHHQMPVPIEGKSPQRDPAATLRPYRDRWVALQRDDVLTDGASFSEVLAWLRRNGIKADTVFRVPANPDDLLAGLSD